MACVVLINAARHTSIGCHCEPIAAVDAAAIHEYTENNRTPPTCCWCGRRKALYLRKGITADRWGSL